MLDASFIEAGNCCVCSMYHIKAVFCLPTPFGLENKHESMHYSQDCSPSFGLCLCISFGSLFCLPAISNPLALSLELANTVEAGPWHHILLFTWVLSHIQLQVLILGKILLSTEPSPQLPWQPLIYLYTNWEYSIQQVKMSSSNELVNMKKKLASHFSKKQYFYFLIIILSVDYMSVLPARMPVNHRLEVSMDE